MTADLVVSMPLFAPLVILQLQMGYGRLEGVHQLVLALLLGRELLEMLQRRDDLLHQLGHMVRTVAVYQELKLLACREKRFNLGAVMQSRQYTNFQT